MAEVQARAIALCNSKDLSNGGRAVPFDVMFSGQTCRAFAVRYHDGVHAYLNRCTHVAMELDWQPNRFLNLGASFVHGTDLLLRASLRLHPEEPPIVPREAPPPLVPRPAPVPETAAERADPSWGERLGRALRRAAAGHLR